MIGARLISALPIYLIQPGPLLFAQDPGLVWGMIAAALVSNVLMFVMMPALVTPLAKLMSLPKG